ncbi:Uma2 family endonuclease [Argonema antarcticum]|uniref:Uma2 family endonuclease n=1 Tax=Argonema antarcticum TaxID=2942763 RepID=UPI0020124F85|nr:Uma2 family endonuclease [Argonema antarcticum]MCL1472514.1 Uma2 family endonuclease [Argonema antarcticum A004/B2]
MSVQLLRRKFTVEQYHQMVDAGILTEDDRVELIRGEIVEMASIGRRHAAGVNRLVRLFTQLLGDNIILSPQNPVELNDASEPQPDIALLQPRPDFYESGHPQIPDIILLVEVADTTVEADRNVKITLYAENDIVEAWLVDINEQCVEVYRSPSPTGYQNVQRFQRGESLSILAFTDINITVDEVLG